MVKLKRRVPVQQTAPPPGMCKDGYMKQHQLYFGYRLKQCLVLLYFVVIVSVIYNFEIFFTLKSFKMRMSSFLSKGSCLPLEEAGRNPEHPSFSVFKLHVTS